MLRFLLLTALCFTLQAEQAVVTQPLIVAHRGASHVAPENTLPAFILAWEKGADAIEADFHLTQDGHIVCIHNASTGKYARENLIIKESTLAELREIEVGGWKAPQYAGTPIPTLRAVLETVSLGKTLYLEIKCGKEIIPPLVQELRESTLEPSQVVFICFDTQVIAELKQYLPEHQAYWLVSRKEPKQEEILQTLAEIKADGLSSNYHHTSQELVQAVKAAGYSHHIWTLNDASSLPKFQSWGIKSITTDRPSLFTQ